MPNVSHAPHEDIVVFDFDGTITTKDTFALFLKYYAGTLRWALNIFTLLPTFAAYGLRLIDRNAVKAKVVRRFFKNTPVDQLNSRAEKFAKDVIPGLIRPLAMDEIDRHKRNQESIFICSASISPYLRVWGEDNSLTNVLATELKQSGGRYTGDLQDFNVWGPGKISKLDQELGEDSYRIKEAYGDSRGDEELLNAADVSHWRPFRLRELKN